MLALALVALLVRLLVGPGTPATREHERVLRAAHPVAAPSTGPLHGSPERGASAERRGGGATVGAPPTDGPAGAATGAPTDTIGARAASSSAPVRTNAVDERLTAAVRAHVAAAVETARGLAQPRQRDGPMVVGVHVKERGVPGDLVALRADRPMRPASNMKVVTTAVALVLLGPAWSFETPFEVMGPVRGGRLEGPLVARASGDPVYDPDGDPGAVPAGFLDPLVRALEAEGVRRISGGLLLDEQGFVAPGPGPAWPSSNQHDQEYCARSGGFTVGGGCLTATVRSRQPGQAARVRVDPVGHGLVEAFDVDTVAARKPLVVHVQARGGRATVRGRIPADVSAWSTRFAHEDPVELFGEVVRARLEAASIVVEGPLLRERDVPRGRELVRLTTPLATTLVPINTHSNNAVADQVFFATGHAVLGHGTREGGRAATALALERLGVPVDGLVQVDGSGLSRDNRVTARQITALVDAVLALERETAEAFLGSLAVAGRTGTLEDRLAGVEGRVRAKTGFIGGTSALSGIVTTTRGRELVFSILVEYPVVSGLNRRAWKPMQDAICATLAGADG